MDRNDESERTHPPTQQRLLEARQRGQVARSGELTAALVLLAGGGALWLAGPALVAELTRMLAAALDAPIGRESLGDLGQAIAPSALRAAMLAGAVIAASVAAAVLGNMVQVGLLYSPEAVAPKWERVSPSAGLARLASTRGLARLGETAVKIAAVSVVAYATIKPSVMAIVAAGGEGIAELASSVGEMIIRLMIRVAGVLLALAVLDWLYQRWQHRQDLSMTDREMREELRRSEGDPAVRSRRQAGRQLSAQKRSVEVPRASVVVTAPWGLAVAVRLAAGMRVPRVTAKATNDAGRQMQELARRSGVPIVEDRDLALAIFKRCAVGDAAPRTLHERLAEVLAFAQHVRDSDADAAKDAGAYGTALAGKMPASLEGETPSALAGA